MAKRKRKPSGRKPFQLKVKDYRSDEYVPYIMNAETGILQADATLPSLTDGQVDDALRQMIARLKQPGGLEAMFAKHSLLEGEIVEVTIETDAPLQTIQQLVIVGLKRAFEKYGPLPPEDVIGILKVIRRSIKTWGYGPNQRGYLIYLQDFLGKVGVHVQKLSAEEYQTMFGEEPPALNRPTPKENDF